MIKQACQCDAAEMFRRLGLQWEPRMRATCLDAAVLSRGVTDSPELEGWLVVSGSRHYCPACATVLQELVDHLRPVFEALPAAPISSVSWDDPDGTKWGLGPAEGAKPQ